MLIKGHMVFDPATIFNNWIPIFHFIELRSFYKHASFIYNGICLPSNTKCSETNNFLHPFFAYGASRLRMSTFQYMYVYV